MMLPWWGRGTSRLQAAGMQRGKPTAGSLPVHATCLAALPPPPVLSLPVLLPM